MKEITARIYRMAELGEVERKVACRYVASILSSRSQSIRKCLIAVLDGVGIKPAYETFTIDHEACANIAHGIPGLKSVSFFGRMSAEAYLTFASDGRRPFTDWWAAGWRCDLAIEPNGTVSVTELSGAVDLGAAALAPGDACVRLRNHLQRHVAFSKEMFLQHMNAATAAIAESETAATAAADSHGFMFCKNGQVCDVPLMLAGQVPGEIWVIDQDPTNDVKPSRRIVRI